MLVGLGAAVVQGADAVTTDLDLWFRSTAHPGSPEAARRSVQYSHGRNNPPLFSGPGLDDIDIVIKCDGLRDFDAEYAAAIDIALAPGLIVKVLPIDRVLASKRAADRPEGSGGDPGPRGGDRRHQGNRLVGSCRLARLLYRA